VGEGWGKGRDEVRVRMRGGERLAEGVVGGG